MCADGCVCPWARVPLDVCADGRRGRWARVPLDMCADGRVCPWACVPLDMCAGGYTQPPLAYMWATSSKHSFLTQWDKTNSLTIQISRELFPHEMFHHQNIYYTRRAWRRRKILTYMVRYFFTSSKKKVLKVSYFQKLFFNTQREEVSHKHLPTSPGAPKLQTLIL